MNPRHCLSKMCLKFDVQTVTDCTSVNYSIKPMMGSEPMTFRLQGECSSQAELHWHEFFAHLEALKCYLNFYRQFLICSNLEQIVFKLKYMEPYRLKVIMAMFFGTGTVGIVMGLNFSAFYLTMLGTINLCLGGFFGWIFLTQAPRPRDYRKKKRSGDK